MQDAELCAIHRTSDGKGELTTRQRKSDGLTQTTLDLLSSMATPYGLVKRAQSTIVPCGERAVCRSVTSGTPFDAA